ncbi:MAG: 30S ribosomal protein S18 [Planctomycetes bacterium]|nr:30S ribosomal protein S18 [Planctomycetota bacterium]
MGDAGLHGDGDDFGGRGGGRRGGSGGRRGGKFARFGTGRRIVEPEEPLEYKNVAYLQKFVGPTGKIMSSRRTGFSGQNQRKLARAIKNARMIGLLPFVGKA